MKPYIRQRVVINGTSYENEGRITYCWRYRMDRYGGRIGARRHTGRAHWPLRYLWREGWEGGYHPYPPPEVDIWQKLDWRRRRQRAAARTYPLVEAKEGTTKHAVLWRRARVFHAAASPGVRWRQPVRMAMREA